MVRKGLLIVVLAAACGTTPTQSLPSTESTATPAATIGENPAPSPPPPSAAALDVELQALAAAHQPCSTSLWNLGTEIMWARYAPRHESCPDLWRYVPGAAEPELVFRSDDREAMLGPVVGAGGAYVFLERDRRGVIDLGWRLWYVAHAGAERRQIAAGVDGGQTSATLVADDERFIWAAVDPLEPTTSRLHLARWSDPNAITTIATDIAQQGSIWYPTLNSNELWYGIIRDGATNGAQDDIRIEMLDISSPAATPVAMPGVGREFNPAVSDDVIVYKRTELGFAPLNWGTIAIIDRRTNRGSDIAGDGNRPTIGDRFVTFETIGRDRVYVYDPIAPYLHTVRVAEGNGGFDAPSIRGDLLAFVQFPEDGPGTIWWGRLPG